MSRAFRGRARQAIYVAAGGRCQSCGVELGNGWHGDHIVPFSEGGPTDVLNGQALCGPCNIEKGARMAGQWPSSIVLRKWQEEAFRTYRAHPRRDFLMVATPGGGKTMAALKIASERLLEGSSQRVAIVCPTQHLKDQWAAAANCVGINLDPEFSGYLTSDFVGVVATYQQVAANPQPFRTMCQRPTLAILDEVHHAADAEDMAWGNALRVAFDPAAYRLLLSGTPFRSDNNPIPFVTYENDASRADYTYGYGDALADDVCRRVLFPSYETRAKWFAHGRRREATFADSLSREASAQRLNTVLRSDSEWVAKVLADANARLMAIRSDDHPEAGGLIVTKDKYNAAMYADRLKRITGHEAIVVTSDDADASSRIKAYAASRDAWIVAVKMISEGVDIPRLRVCVFASNVQTEMYFRQVVGRIVRAQPHLGVQDGYMFIPSDPVLIEYAEKIKEEREHTLEQEIEEALRAARDLGEGAGDDKVASPFVPIQADGMAHDTIVDTDRVTSTQRQEAEQLCRQCGFPPGFDPALLALALQADRSKRPTPHAQHAAQPVAQTPAHETRAALRKAVHKLAGRLAAIKEVKHEVIFGQLTDFDGQTAKSATIAQLEKRVSLLQARIQEIINGRNAA